MQIIDNINTTVKGDLQSVIHKGSKLSIAASCFSIYAYQELKKQLAFAYEGDPRQINEKLATTKSIDETFRQAQKAYNA